MVDATLDQRRTLVRPLRCFFFFHHFHEWKGVEEGEVGLRQQVGPSPMSDGAPVHRILVFLRYTRVTRASVTLSAAICRASFRRSEPTPRGNRIGSEAYREESKERGEEKKKKRERERETRSPRLSAEA